ncbi:unnamed protein product, partial [Linum tenue]
SPFSSLGSIRIAIPQRLLLAWKLAAFARVRGSRELLEQVSYRETIMIAASLLTSRLRQIEKVLLSSPTAQELGRALLLLRLSLLLALFP